MFERLEPYLEPRPLKFTLTFPKSPLVRICYRIRQLHPRVSLGRLVCDMMYHHVSLRITETVYLY